MSRLVVPPSAERKKRIIPAVVVAMALIMTCSTLTKLGEATPVTTATIVPVPSRLVLAVVTWALSILGVAVNCETVAIVFLLTEVHVIEQGLLRCLSVIADDVPLRADVHQHRPLRVRNERRSQHH